MVTRQGVVIFSFMVMTAGLLLMIGSDGADVFFWIGLVLVFGSFFGWIVVLMWKISGVVDKAVEEHL